MWGRAGLSAAVAGGLLAALGVSQADDGEIYRWTDESGVVRYTPERSRVPLSARDTIVVVAPPATETNGGSAEPATPGALPALMGRKLPEELLEPATGADGADPAAMDERIAALREAVARDRQALQELAGDRGWEDGSEAARERDGRIREIANRLPALQEELARLERLRAGLPVGPEP